MNVSIGSLEELTKQLKTEQELEQYLKEVKDRYKFNKISFDNTSGINIRFSESNSNSDSYHKKSNTEFLYYVRLSEERKETIKDLVLMLFEEQIKEAVKLAKKNLANEALGGLE